MKNRVEGHQNIYKDEYTGVIDNRSKSERERYRISKQQAMRNLETQDELEDVKEELKELKGLIRQLLRKP